MLSMKPGDSFGESVRFKASLPELRWFLLLGEIPTMPPPAYWTSGGGS